MKNLEIVKFDNPTYIDGHPDFFFEKEDASYCVFVENSLDGHPSTSPASEEKKRDAIENLKGNGKFADIFFVKCEMKTSGNGYSFSFPDLGGIEKIAGDISNSFPYEVAAEHYKIVEIGKPSDDSPAPFDPQSILSACKKSFEEENLSHLAIHLSEKAEVLYENKKFRDGKDNVRTSTFRTRFPVLRFFARIIEIKNSEYKNAAIETETDNLLDFALDETRHLKIYALEGIGTFATKIKIEIA